ncbi:MULTISPECIES: hypothetical protein [Flavobacteriaceae]|uniref:DUF2933 domain-containing protein n=2 Tax=Flavobacteriaceae TaxID=49546 RepID=A0A3N4NPY7_9FLAO|nr:MULTISPECIES: hypothetical protein [Flavobacteriaceae]MCK0190707.1 hypothetical protein [Arenibacter sp. F20364]MDO6675186.1 hypothetical protein [Tenacibaculum sp. 1_MG-2023]RPD97665.1 hypothetical protein EGM88_07665 [Aureibaculum marinum]
MKSHTLWMILGCVLPLLLIFIAPSIGMGENVSLFIFIILMFGCHLLMPHHKHNHDKENNNKPQL